MNQVMIFFPLLCFIMLKFFSLIKRRSVCSPIMTDFMGTRFMGLARYFIGRKGGPATLSLLYLLYADTIGIPESLKYPGYS